MPDACFGFFKAWFRLFIELKTLAKRIRVLVSSM